MSRRLLLDTGPLGLAVKPRGDAEFDTWFRAIRSDGFEVCIPEIAVYELRRELLRIRSVDSLAILAEYVQTLTYLPITTPIILRATELWAESVSAEDPPLAPRRSMAMSSSPPPPNSSPRAAMTCSLPRPTLRISRCSQPRRSGGTSARCRGPSHTAEGALRRARAVQPELPAGPARTGRAG